MIPRKPQCSLLVRWQKDINLGCFQFEPGQSVQPVAWTTTPGCPDESSCERTQCSQRTSSIERSRVRTLPKEPEEPLNPTEAPTTIAIADHSRLKALPSWLQVAWRDCLSRPREKKDNNVIQASSDFLALTGKKPVLPVGTGSSRLVRLAEQDKLS